MNHQPSGEVSAPAAVLPEPSTVDFRAVYQAHFGAVWAVLRRLGVYERDLEDAAHEVFIVFFRRLDVFDAARSARPWLCGIAARVAADFRKKAVHRREQPRADLELLDAHEDPQRTLRAREARRLVRAALDELDDDRRAVLVLIDLEGHSAPELVDALELPLNTIYSRLRLARRDFMEAVDRLREEPR